VSFFFVILTQFKIVLLDKNYDFLKPILKDLLG